ncbi:MAG: tRNA uracil 4-sulfurtransferase ThiI [Thermoplasmata archaeon]
MFIIRYSEIGLKGQKERSLMEKLLRENITNYYSTYGIIPKVWSDHGHIYTDAEIDDPLRYIMGIKSYSRCSHFKLAGIESIAKFVDPLYREKIRGKKFAVRCRRTGNHDFTSIDVQRYIGDIFYDDSAGVDLENPDVSITIEIRDHDVYVYDDVINGPGGLPLGSQGKMISLVSGGIDSPVATWMMMKRGSPCDILFCSLSDPVDTESFMKIASPFIRRWAPYRNDRIFIADCRPLIKMLTGNKDVKYSNVTYKRIIYRIAESIAEKYHENGIVTGESLGQVSSQTAENLRSIENGINLPIYRPLIGFDKDEIVRIARNIGTYPEDNLGEFCALFADHPITRSSSDQIDDDMKYVDIPSILQNVRVIHFQDMDKISDGIDLRYREGLDKEMLIDLRTEREYKKSHIKGSVNMNVADLEKISDKSKTYVFYCNMGLQSAYAASLLNSRGFKAYYETYRNLVNGKKFEVQGI